MMNKQAEIRLDELVYKSLEGIITEAECREFEMTLASDADAVEYYISCIEFNNRILKVKDSINKPLRMMMAFEEMAEYEKTAPVLELPKEQTQRELIQKIVYPPREKQKLSKLTIFTLLNVAAVILFFVILRFTPSKGGVEVATLTDSINAKWADITLFQGARLKSDGSPLMLREGMAELLFDNHTKVVIEAPAEFELVSKEQVYLRYGRLYAAVPVEGVGFSVNTSNSRIIDLGTEFGVNADAHGDTSLHVIKGKTILIAGDKSNRETIEVARGEAKKVSAATQTISEISCNDHLFVRKIDSTGYLIWRGETVINLADIVGGGSGFGGGTLNGGIDPSTGKMVPDFLDDQVKVGSSGYKNVDNCQFIDGVFVPGLEEGETPITADGSVSVNFPQTGGNYWGYIVNGAFHKGDEVPRHSLRLNGMSFGTPENPAISIHSNQGITFDLSMIRKTMPDMNIAKFSSLIGISETVKTYAIEAKVSDQKTLSKGVISTADFWIFLDGKKVYELEMTDSDEPVQVEVPISTRDRYLTLAVTQADSGCAYDWALFGRPELVMEPIE